MGEKGGAEQRVLQWLERADFTGTGCRHSQQTIALALGYNRRTVIRACQALAADGRITVAKERRPGCKWLCNVYRVRHWNPHKRSGVLGVLASIRERRLAQCHTEGTATPTRAQTPSALPPPHCETSTVDAAREENPRSAPRIGVGSQGEREGSRDGRDKAGRTSPAANGTSANASRDIQGCGDVEQRGDPRPADPAGGVGEPLQSGDRCLRGGRPQCAGGVSPPSGCSPGEQRGLRSLGEHGLVVSELPAPRAPLRLVADPELERYKRMTAAMQLDLDNHVATERALRRQITTLRNELAEKRHADKAYPIAVVIFEYWVKHVCPNAYVFSEDREKAVLARLHEKRHNSQELAWTPRYICEAILGAKHDHYVDPKGQHHKDLELICRNGRKLKDFHDRYERWKAKQ